MKKFSGLYWLLPMAALFIQACGDQQRAKNYNQETRIDQRGLEFIKTVSEAGLVEIKTSTLAVNLSKNPRVIAFAKMMIADHTQAGKELSNVANGNLVDKADTITAQKQKSIDSLQKLSGNKFDHAYMNMMVKDHSAAVELFKQEANNRNTRMNMFANKYLPTIKMHLDSANAICASLK